VWFFDKKSVAFGAMADLGIHKADLIHYLLDDTIKSAMAVTGALDKKIQMAPPFLWTTMLSASIALKKVSLVPWK